MANNLRICLLVIVCLIFLSVSCEKIAEKQVWMEGDIGFEKLPRTDLIPLDWGDLVSVSSANGEAGWVQLWFQNEKGDIHMAVYNTRKMRLYPNARVFRRE